MLYRKKPVEIEAIQWTGDNFDELERFTDNSTLVKFLNHELLVYTLEGVMHASIGDYIIKGVEGEFYPCKPDIFNKTYEKV
jgi:hypothetical protein